MDKCFAIFEISGHEQTIAYIFKSKEKRDKLLDKLDDKYLFGVDLGYDDEREIDVKYYVEITHIIQNDYDIEYMQMAEESSIKIFDETVGVKSENHLMLSITEDEYKEKDNDMWVRKFKERD